MSMTSSRAGQRCIGERFGPGPRAREPRPERAAQLSPPLISIVVIGLGSAYDLWQRARSLFLPRARVHRTHATTTEPTTRGVRRGRPGPERRSADHGRHRQAWSHVSTTAADDSTTTRMDQSASRVRMYRAAPRTPFVAHLPRISSSMVRSARGVSPSRPWGPGATRPQARMRCASATSALSRMRRAGR